MKTRRTKELKLKYEWYKNSTAKTLRDVYGRWSNKKQEAYEDCISFMESLNGHDLKIIGHNCDMFSVGFEYTENGLNYFVYITPTRTEQLLLND